MNHEEFVDEFGEAYGFWSACDWLDSTEESVSSHVVRTFADVLDVRSHAITPAAPLPLSNGGVIEASQKWRDREFPQLKDQVYVDHAGATVCAQAQLDASHAFLSSTLLGNPHSGSSSSFRSTRLVENTRDAVLDWLNASTNDYDVVFTLNASGALKLVGETFPWTTQSHFCHSLENHNSVLGIREYAQSADATVKAFDVAELASGHTRKPTARTYSGGRGEQLELEQGGTERDPEDGICSLVAFPLECNFSGRRLGQESVQCARKMLPTSHRAFVLLDAAVYVAHAPLDLSELRSDERPDFVALSFYKVFGWPTGVGALVVRKDSARFLRKRYFGGGTVEAALPDDLFVAFRGEPHERLEDGTVAFSQIPLLRHGLRVVSELTMERIERHTHALRAYLTRNLEALCHYNGQPLVEIVRANHGEKTRDDNDDNHHHHHHHNNNNNNNNNDGHNNVDKMGYGPICSVNLRRANGEWIGYSQVERLASLSGIHLRTACFCNPGACRQSIGLRNEDVVENHLAGHVCWDSNDIMGGKPTGAIRVSLGYMSTVADIDRLVKFFASFFLQSRDDSNSAPSATTHPPDTGEWRKSVLLERVYVYPVKSCAALAVRESWPLGPHGLLYDRFWALVDGRGRVMSLKRHPKMSLVYPHLDLERGVLYFSAPHMSRNSPLVSVRGTHEEDSGKLHSPEVATNSQLRETRVCGDHCEVSEEHNDRLARWLSEALDCSCRLVRFGEHASRGGENAVAFANDAQFLLVSTESISDLNRRVLERNRESGTARVMHVLPERFRPNLVVCGGVSYDEDSWSDIRIGDATFRTGRPCSRCQIVCVDPTTGERGKEPLLTMAMYRRRAGEIHFGRLFSHTVDVSKRAVHLKVGERVVVNESE